MAEQQLPVSNLPSNDDLKWRVRKHYKNIVSAANPTPLIDFLFQEDVISQSDVTTLRKIKIPSDACRELLELLFKSVNPKAFQVFVRALQDECRWLADDILQKSPGVGTEAAPLPKPPVQPQPDLPSRSNSVDKRSSTIPSSAEIAKIRIDPGSQPATHQSSLVGTLHTSETIWSAAYLQGRFYVICPEKSIIFAFDEATKNLIAELDVKGMKSATDIVANERTNSLFVADCRWQLGPMFVWVIRPDLQDVKKYRVEVFLSAQEAKIQPWSISLYEDKLLVTSVYAKQLVHFLVEDASECRRITLPTHLEPRHSVETSRETFIVSSTSRPDGVRGPQRHLVSEVDFSGNVVRSFGGHEEIIGWPEYVVLDVDGKVLVTDGKNRRILRLTSDLELDSIVLDNLDNRQWRMNYVTEKRWLLIPSGNTVNIYQL